MGIIDLIIQLVKAVATYLQYRFDPKTVAKLDAEAKEDKNEAYRNEFTDALAKQRPLSLSALINARLNEFKRVRGEESDSATRPSGDFLGTKLPQQPEPTRDVAVPGDAPGGLEPPK